MSSGWFEDYVDYSGGYMRSGSAQTLGEETLPSRTELREFPIGFHVAAPGPSKPEKQRIRKKALSRKIRETV